MTVEATRSQSATWPGSVLDPTLLSSVTSRASGTGALMPLPTPWSEVALGQVAKSTPDDVASAAQAARKAQKQWATTPLSGHSSLTLTVLAIPPWASASTSDL